MKIEKQKFEEMVGRSVAKIPEKFKTLIKNVAFVVEETPSPEQLEKMGVPEDETLFGLYEGVPRTARGENYGIGLTLPDKITIFKKPIEEEAENEKGAEKIVSETVWHEVAHHFGLDEGDVEKREAARDNLKLSRSSNISRKI